ncbi:hypothetical protein ACHAWO_000081 [Cyclotella atomus]|uniref:Fucolectin tachylectin-4 pentraxin-1 domain-containing protein n=1 Tax=Cyclotella atomus TaxID=382360 RepID=A0ABD3PHN3_9STRA
MDGVDETGGGLLIGKANTADCFVALCLFGPAPWEEGHGRHGHRPALKLLALLSLGLNTDSVVGQLHVNRLAAEPTNRALTACYPNDVSKIRISSTTGTALQFHEIRALTAADIDVASGKPASQSSTYTNKSNYAASKAVDGVISTFSHTDPADTTPTWEVNLGGAFEITTVDVLNRYCGSTADSTGCLCKLSSATVSLMDSGGLSKGTYRFGNTCGVMNPVLDLGTSCSTSVSLSSHTRHLSLEE